MTDELIAVSLPFVISIIMQVLQPGVRAYAERATLITFPKSIYLSDEYKKLCVDLAVHTYVHLSFVFSVLLSSVSCIGYTILSKKPILAAAGAVALITFIPFWLINWQGLTASELQGSKGRVMRRCSWGTIIVLWILTVYARFAVSNAN
jgi:hypothetical protein